MGKKIGYKGKHRGSVEKQQMSKIKPYWREGKDSRRVDFILNETK